MKTSCVINAIRYILIKNLILGEPKIAVTWLHKITGTYEMAHDTNRTEGKNKSIYIFIIAFHIKLARGVIYYFTSFKYWYQLSKQNVYIQLRIKFDR